MDKDLSFIMDIENPKDILLMVNRITGEVVNQTTIMVKNMSPIFLVQVNKRGCGMIINLITRLCADMLSNTAVCQMMQRLH